MEQKIAVLSFVKFEGISFKDRLRFGGALCDIDPLFSVVEPEILQGQIPVYQDRSRYLRPDQGLAGGITVKNLFYRLMVGAGENGQCVPGFKKLHAPLEGLESCFHTFAVGSVPAVGGNEILSALQGKEEQKKCCRKNLFHTDTYSL